MERERVPPEASPLTCADSKEVLVDEYFLMYDDTMSAETNRATLAIPCPQCGAEVDKPCFPANKKYTYEVRDYVHKARHVAFAQSLRDRPRRWFDKRTALDAPPFASLSFDKDDAAAADIAIAWANGYNAAVAALRDEMVVRGLV